MQINHPQLSRCENQTIYSVQVVTSFGERSFWFSVDREFEDFIQTSCDAPLIALLIPAMASGEDIQIRGKVSERLYHSLSNSVQILLRRVIPSLHQISIHPEELSTQDQRAEGVAAGFSGGIDSFSLLDDYYLDEQIPAGNKLTHLLFNNVGSNGNGARAEKLFLERYARVKPLADRLNLPFIKVNSNVNDFYNNHLDHEQTHTIRNASVAHLLQNGISRWMYASAYSFDQIFVGKTRSLAHTDPILLPLLSTEVLDCVSVGSEYTRIEKTLQVAEIPESYTTLNVCVKNAANCSLCTKCLRTLLTMEIAGVLDRYSSVFDLDIYRQHRDLYIGKLLQNEHPFAQEIIHFAKEKNFPLPKKYITKAKINDLKNSHNPIMRLARRVNWALKKKNGQALSQSWNKEK